MAKELKNPYLKIIGGNATDVTGSANLIKFKNSSILIDYGMVQTSDAEKDHFVNIKRHKDVRPKELDAVILTHIHQDHSGLIPALFKDGARCNVYVPKETKKALTLMWQDSVKIFESDKEKYNWNTIYTQDDVDKALNHIVEIDLYERVQINNNISFIYYNAQHIVKACQVLLELKDGETTKRIGFTGDFSSYKNKYFLNNRDTLPYCDIIVGEATYSDNKRKNNESKDRKNDLNKIDMAIKYAIENKSKIVIPTFSLDRLENILATLYEFYNGNCPIRILVDTPLGLNIANIWEYLIDKDFDLWNRVKNWDNVYWVSDYKDSQHFMNIKEPMLVLAGGGMIAGGRARAWCKSHLANHNDRIMFCGYATPNSIAGQIRSEQKEIKIDGKIIKNKALTTVLNSFSSHADYNHLIKYYTEVGYNKLILVHSEYDSKIKFAEELRKELSKINRSSKIVVANKDQKVHI